MSAAKWEHLANEAIADAAHWKAEGRKAQRQRDELLAALRDVMNGQIGGQPDMNAERFQRARAAIADTNNWE